MKWLCLLPLGLLTFACLNAADELPFAKRDAQLQAMVDESIAAALTEFAARKLQSNQVAVTLVDLSDARNPRLASHRGDVPIYPASVVKLFYLAAAHRWLEDGKLQDTPELRRALRDMIVESSNDATHYVLDALTDTTSGPELTEAEMKDWGEKRNSVNRFFATLGYQNINANQKPWCEGPYGRDRIWVATNYSNRNMLTTDATARLLSEIVQRRFISASRCEQMLDLLKRDPANQKDGQARYTVSSLPPGGKLYSKAGWTSTTRHDAACIELAEDRTIVLVTFTTGQATTREIIPFLAQRLLDSGPRKSLPR